MDQTSVISLDTTKFLSLDGLKLFTNNILSIIEENELVTATAITDLDDRLKNHSHTFVPSGESTIPDEYEDMTF